MGWTWNATDLQGRWYWTKPAAKAIYESLVAAWNQRIDVIRSDDFWATRVTADYSYPINAYRALMAKIVAGLNSSMMGYYLRSHDDDGTTRSPEFFAGSTDSDDIETWTSASIRQAAFGNTDGWPMLPRGVALPADPLDLTDEAFTHGLYSDRVFGPWVPWAIRAILSRMIWTIHGGEALRDRDIREGESGLGGGYEAAKAAAVADYQVQGSYTHYIECYTEVDHWDDKCLTTKVGSALTYDDLPIPYACDIDLWLPLAAGSGGSGTSVFDNQGLAWATGEGYRKATTISVAANPATDRETIPMDIQTAPNHWPDPEPAETYFYTGFVVPGGWSGPRVVRRFDVTGGFSSY